MISQEKYLHKPQGRIEDGWEVWEEGADSRIRRMFYFCQLWVGISCRSGLNVSLSHYKDKYIIERGTETWGLTDVLLFRWEPKPLRGWDTYH